MIDLDTLADAWKQAKAAEQKAQDERREIEDRMLSLVGITGTEEETVTAETPTGFKIKITGRMNRKVNSDLLQHLAAEAGLSDHLATLFRWKPEINMKAWQAAAPNITRPLEQAITTKAGRPSFTITRED